MAASHGFDRRRFRHRRRRLGRLRHGGAAVSEDRGTRVVLLEAGGADRQHCWIHVPLGYGKTITDKRVNWCYETEPDPA